MSGLPYINQSVFKVAGGMKKRLAGWLCRVAASFFLDFFVTFFIKEKSKAQNIHDF
jgi:hypothetical protein